MRASEFIGEGKHGKIPKAEKRASTELVKMRDDGIDRTYHLNRIMMATAMHDGKSKKPVDMDAVSWADRYNTAHPYTKEESNMIHGALKTIGGKHEDIIKDPRSRELPEINTKSPVASFKGYQRKVNKSTKKKK